MMKNKGFTLIELLVVIGIIGMLVAIAIPNYLSARQRASDSKKKEEMSQLKNALRLYYNDFSSYPSGVPPTNSIIKGCYSAADGDGKGACPCNSTVDFASGASCDTVYMKHFPADFSSKYKYYQTSSGNDFCLTVALDNKSDPDTLASHLRCEASCGGVSNCPASKYCVCAD